MTDPARPRNAAATKAAILSAARARFLRHGYDGVGLRDVAADAAVNVALVHRYYGSKEALFEAAVREDFSPGALLDGDRAALGERLARAVLGKDAAGGALDPFVTLLRSATSEPAATLLRDGIDAGFVRPLAAWLGGEDAEARAALVAAALSGLALSRFVVRDPALVAADPDVLVRRAADLLQRLVDPPSSAI